VHLLLPQLPPGVLRACCNHHGLQQSHQEVLLAVACWCSLARARNIWGCCPVFESRGPRLLLLLLVGVLLLQWLLLRMLLVLLR
jgi:hypothetical protein